MYGFLFTVTFLFSTASCQFGNKNAFFFLSLQSFLIFNIFILVQTNYTRRSDTKVHWILTLILEISYGAEPKNCLFICSRDDNCMGLNIDFNTRLCQLFNFIAPSYLRPAQGIEFYQKTKQYYFSKILFPKYSAPILTNYFFSLIKFSIK